MYMDIVISLKPDDARVFMDFSLVNPTPLRQRWWQWTNVGVSASVSCRDEIRLFQRQE